MTTTITAANVYPGTWKSGIARCKKVLLAAGFVWSTTTGRYTPFNNQQKTTRGVRVTRVGCSKTVAVHARGYEFRPRDDARWVEALAIATLREAGLPMDDRGWMECAEDT